MVVREQREQKSASLTLLMLFSPPLTLQSNDLNYSCYLNRLFWSFKLLCSISETKSYQDSNRYISKLCYYWYKYFLILKMLTELNGWNLYSSVVQKSYHRIIIKLFFANAWILLLQLMLFQVFNKLRNILSQWEAWLLKAMFVSVSAIEFLIRKHKFLTLDLIKEHR